MQFFGKTSINFVGYRKTAFVISAILIGAGMVSLAVKRGPDFGIDFAGGMLLHVRFEKPVETEAVRSALGSAGYAKSEIQVFSGGTEVLIRSPQAASGGVNEIVKQALRDAFPDDPFSVRREEMVGPRIGKELGKKAVWATLFSLGAMLVYIGWRFEFRFAVAAVLGLLHNVLAVLGIFSLTGKEISLAVIAAFLTIVGYSINDTIVVFDRIREDLRKYHKGHFEDVINASLNETLSRTIITGLCTLLVLVVLLAFGGEVLRDFSFGLLIGIIIGTYSSVFVATPILVEWNLRSPMRR